MNVEELAKPYLTSRPVSLPLSRANVLEYRTVEFWRNDTLRLKGDFRLEGAGREDLTAVRVFFRPPQPGKSDAHDRVLPDQPVAPDNKDLFLTEEGLDAVRVPPTQTENCILDLPSEGEKKQ